MDTLIENIKKKKIMMKKKIMCDSIKLNNYKA